MTFLSLTARVALLTAFATPALADLGPLVTPAELAAALQTDAPLVLDKLGITDLFDAPDIAAMLAFIEGSERSLLR